MNELLLQIPVIGMEVEQFLLLLITALAGGAFGADRRAARIHLHRVRRLPR